MTATMRIDFVSDVVCPWCVIGLKSLETALARLDGEIAADIHFQPFELNPGMAPEGENVAEHIARKYGRSANGSGDVRTMIRDSAAALGFTMNTNAGSRIWNTFDAHRLLHWAGLAGRQRELKEALFKAHFTDGRNVSDRAVLADIAAEAGLSREGAADVLESGRYADEVRRDEEFWRDQNITGVPAIIIDRQFAIMGGQPVDTFERVLRKIVEKRAAAA
jgi:predicted DsbA family dithiol-disulfide isomerase